MLDLEKYLSDISEWQFVIRAYSGNGQSPYDVWSGSTYSSTCPDNHDTNIYKSELVAKWEDIHIAKVVGN